MTDRAIRLARIFELNDGTPVHSTIRADSNLSSFRSRVLSASVAAKRREEFVMVPSERHAMQPMEAVFFRRSLLDHMKFNVGQLRDIDCGRGWLCARPKWLILCAGNSRQR